MMPGLVPGIFGFATAGWREAMIAMSFQRHCEERSDEAIHLSSMPRSGLLRFARNDGCSLCVRDLSLELAAMPRYGNAPRAKLFIISIHRIFTTLIEQPFTNAIDAVRKNGATSCVCCASHAD